MAISSASGTRFWEAQTPLLDDDFDDAVDGYEDYKGFPIKRSKSGGWRSASFILGGAAIEKFAYFGVESNLINYLTAQLGQPVATAAVNVNTWIGVVYLMPVLGSLLADSFLGRYRTIIISLLLYILGLSSLTLLAVLTSKSQIKIGSIGVGSDTEFQILLFCSLYLIAIAQAYKSCFQAFGADQFDGKHPKEGRAKSSFFNWYLCGMCTGAAVGHLILHYIQDNFGWGIGFGIPCLAMIVSFILFLLGTRTYRFAVQRSNRESPRESSIWKLAKAGEALHPGAQVARTEEDDHEAFRSSSDDSQKQKLLNNICPGTDNSADHNATSCRSSSINKAKKVLRLLPIWATFLTYTIAFAQISTLFIKQATAMDRSIGQSFNVPAAALRTFFSLSIIFFVTIYDRIFIPIARIITGKPSGITMLQRIGIGMAVTIVCMIIAALIEMKRLEIAQEFGLVDIPNATVPMSFWWVVPQYISFGLADAFIPVGMLEFLYDQVPSEIRSVGLSLYLGAVGTGNLLSSILVFVIGKATSENGRDGWFSDNLNRAHLDYFYWLVAGIGALGLIAFVFCAKSYIYEEENDVEMNSQY